MSQEEKYMFIQPQDEEECDLTTEEDSVRHLVARNGNHLMIPFQCQLCHFRNLKCIYTSHRREDILLIKTVRRTNVDTFWSRKPGIVEATLREGQKMIVVSKMLGLESVFLVMGPIPLSDTQGMGIAMYILLRSLNKVHYQNTLQYESVKKMRSTFLNVWHASNNTLTTNVLAIDASEAYTSPLVLPIFC